MPKNYAILVDLDTFSSLTSFENMEKGDCLAWWRLYFLMEWHPHGSKYVYLFLCARNFELSNYYLGFFFTICRLPKPNSFSKVYVLLVFKRLFFLLAKPFLAFRKDFLQKSLFFLHFPCRSLIGSCFIKFTFKSFLVNFMLIIIVFHKIHN